MFASLDFTEHQRNVFCVFSGNGVIGLRRYLNTRPEFAEYLDLPRPPRRRSTVAHGGETTAGPMLDIDAMEDGDGVEDDDMGDGSEIALDPGNFQQPANANNAVPPPPPLHGPTPANANTGPGPSQPSSHTSTPPIPILTSQGSGAGPSSASRPANAALPNGASAAAGAHGSLEQIVTSASAPTATLGGAAPSTAGASIFGNAGPAAGPSTASLQGPAQDESQGVHGA